MDPSGILIVQFQLEGELAGISPNLDYVGGNDAV
jgi:hypothetical protein